jgi:uncharacterized protein
MVIYTMLDFKNATGFEWEEGNITKNEQHGVSYLESEEIFYGGPLFITPDEGHSSTEQRFRALGRTQAGRLLTVIFTLRKEGTLIRVISARDMHRKERKLYEEET